METVNNIASAASRAIWGDSTQHATGNETVANTEPLSGEKGNVEAGEPYDKGNEGEPVNTGSTTEHTSTTAPPTSSTEQTSTLGSSSTTEPTSSTLGSTSTTARKETSLPTNMNYQKNTDGTLQPEVNPKTHLADDIPAPSTSTNPTSTTDTNTSSSTAEFEKSTTKPIEKDTDTSTGNSNEGSKDAASTEQANLKKDGITETKKEGDHAPKFDTFKTAGGPHIDNVKSDGRVGPDIPKGDLKDFEEVEEEKKVEGEGVTEHKHHDTAGTSDVKKETGAVGSGDSVDSAGKEKVSLKDKIKAKLHKH